MLRFVLSLRYAMLVASVGAAIGAALMFWEGATDMTGAARALVFGNDTTTVITSIMHGTDAFLFGIVLVIFAYAIAFGSSTVLHLPLEFTVLRNRILPFGLNAIIAKVYKDKSWLDGGECIALDYSDTSLVAQWVRDEIRAIAPGVYLGKVYWDDHRLIDFVLEFETGAGPASA